MIRPGRLLLLVLLAVLGVALAAAPPPLRAEESRFIRIGTGPIGGTYFPVGGVIANVISVPPGALACDLGGSCGVPGLIAAAVSTQGSVQNVSDLAARRVELALCQADVAHSAFTGQGRYAEQPVPSLRAIANLFTETVHVVVHKASGITSVSGLRRKRVSMGEADSGTLVTAQSVLRGFGLRPRDFEMVREKLARSAELLSERSIDAFFMVGGPPVAAIAHLAERTPITLLPITGAHAKRILEAQRFYSATVIPPGTYPGVPATETIGVGAQLLVTAALDDELVYEITRALWDERNRKQLDAGPQNTRRVQLASALDGLAVPLHPGALRFYHQAGLLTGSP